MPQAMDLSLATPITRPRLPAISWPVGNVHSSAMAALLVGAHLPTSGAAGQQKRGRLLTRANLDISCSSIYLTANGENHALSSTSRALGSRNGPRRAFRA